MEHADDRDEREHAHGQQPARAFGSTTRSIARRFPTPKWEVSTVAEENEGGLLLTLWEYALRSLEDPRSLTCFPAP